MREVSLREEEEAAAAADDEGAEAHLVEVDLVEGAGEVGDDGRAGTACPVHALLEAGANVQAV